MLVTLALLALSFALLLAGAVLFTNAVEWAGVRVNLGHGAVGSILAAVATALPESVIPVVAIVTGEQTGDIAIGAVIGAPLLLGTLAMTLVGLSALGFRARRRQREELRVDRGATVRDLVVFIVALSAALALSLVDHPVVRIAAAAGLVTGYVFYVWRTLRASGGTGGDEDLRSLFFDPTKHDPPRNVQITVQLLAGLAMIIGGAQLFVTEVEQIAHQFGVAPMVLALVLAPLASELPEKVNSFLWIRQGKDALALGNITGAMAFQSTIPVGVAVAFTDWKLELPAVVAAGAALLGGAICLLAVGRGSRFAIPYVSVWSALYVGTTVTAIAAS